MLEITWKDISLFSTGKCFDKRKKDKFKLQETSVPSFKHIYSLFYQQNRGREGKENSNSVSRIAKCGQRNQRQHLRDH